MKIYEALKQALKEFQVPANKAAEICGVTKGFMSLFLSGKRSTPVENLDEWLKKLDAKYCGIKRFFYSLLCDFPEVNKQVNFNSATSETLVALLKSMDNESLSEMLSKELLSVEEKIVQLIEAADDETIEVVLSAIGRKWKREMQQRNNIQNNYLNNYPEESIAV